MNNHIHSLLIVPAINYLSKKTPIELHILTDASFNRYIGKYGKTDTFKIVQKLFKNAIFHEWDEKTFANYVCSCDLAIIPLSLSDPFAAGKPENKLLLFWRIGMPVVASATPAYVRAMKLAGMDYTVKHNSDWVKILSDLIANPIARHEAGLLGKSYVEKNFSEKILMDQWDGVLESCGFSYS